MANERYMCEVDPLTSEPTWNFFDDLEAAFPWSGVYGDYDNMTFKISDNLSISCLNFEYNRQNPFSSQDRPAQIVALCNGNSFKMYESVGSAFVPTEREYIITSTRYNEMCLQLGMDSRTKNFTDLRVGICVLFAIVRVLNVKNKYIDNLPHFGVYIPASNGGKNSDSSYTFMNPTPRFLLTDDVLTDDGNGSFRMMYDSADAKITMLAPMCSVSTECISAYTRIPLMGKGSSSGYGGVTINGVYYNVRGRLYLYAGRDDEE